MTELPLRARVAYAARCALRVETFLRHYAFMPSDPEWDQAVRGAVRLAIRFAGGEYPEREELETAVSVARMAADKTDFPPWKLGALAALHAAAATLEACAVAPTANTAIAFALAEERACKVRWNVEAAWQAAGALGNIRMALDRDLEVLREISLGVHFFMGPPIDPCGDGPLGPLEPPMTFSSLEHWCLNEPPRPGWLTATQGVRRGDCAFAVREQAL